tara:strand:+ start:2710 stop:3393 length:684 start_codon:yes stop_codon:yes gene_type:complete
MWFDVLKNLQTTQTSGSFDFEEEEIPEQDEDDECKKWLQEYHNIIVKYKGLVSHPIPEPKMNEIPNEVACQIKEWYSKVEDIDTEGTDDNISKDFEFTPFFYFSDLSGFEIGMALETSDNEIIMDSNVTRLATNSLPEKEVENAKKNPQDSVKYDRDFRDGNNYWTIRMCKLGKEFLNHVNAKPSNEEKFIDGLTTMWVRWIEELYGNHGFVLHKNVRRVIVDSYWK